MIHRARQGGSGEYRPVEITDDCDGCAYCIKQFECPALVYHDEDEDNKYTTVDRMICADCGVCMEVCPKGAIVARAEG